MNPNSSDNQNNRKTSPTDPSAGLSFSQRIFSHKSYTAPGSNTQTPSTMPIGTRNAIKLGGIVLGLILFAAAIIGSVFGIALYQKKNQPVSTVATQNLNISDLPKSGAVLNLGDPSQTLTVNSTATFNETLSVKKDLNIGGKLGLGGGISTNALEVTGATKLNTLNATGAVTLQGGLTVTGSLTLNGNANVTGNGTFSGDVSAANVIAKNSFNSGNLIISGHIVTSGTAPTVSPNTSVLGAGSSASIVGNDTAGTVSFRAGLNPGIGSGLLGSVGFRTAFTGAGPRVILTPNGQTAGELMFYVVHNLTGFSVGYTCRVFHGIDPFDPGNPISDASHCQKKLPAGVADEYSFDYQVIQ